MRRFVLEAALGAVGEAFDLDGVFAAGSAWPGSTVSIGRRLPSSVGLSSPLMFEIHGRLWAVLRGSNDAGDSVEQVQIGPRWVCVCGFGGAAPFGAVSVRTKRFTDAEVGALARSLRSVAAVLEQNSPGAGCAPVVVSAVSMSASPGGSTVLAEVTLEPDRVRASGAAKGQGGGAVVGTGKGPDVVTALASATVDACCPQGTIMFAGATRLETSTVTIVLVSIDGVGPPLLGLSIGPHEYENGPVHAVYSVLAHDPGSDDAGSTGL